MSEALPILSCVTLAPLAGGCVVAGLGPHQKVLARRLALGFAGLVLILAAGLWWAFKPEAAGPQFVERWVWIPTLQVEYCLGLDGLNLLMVLLTAVVTPMALLASRGIDERVPLYHALVLFLEAGLLGTFTALNFFHWFLFWELSLVPAFFLVRLWGGPDRGPAATQFFVYTMVGSVTMLLGFLAIFLGAKDYLGTKVFDFMTLADLGRDNRWAAYFHVNLGWYSLTAEQLTMIVFLGILLGFAVKVPMMPFHTWLPATYAVAPAGVTMLLTGLMSKMGVYGFARILVPLFPEQVRLLLTPLLWLAVATIVFSAAAAFAQRDLKRMLAYSSVNHLGYCLLGLVAAARFTGADAGPAGDKAAALNGVWLQMFNHGLTAATLFGFVGFLEARGGGLRGLDDFGGLRKVAPVFCGLMGIALFASLGLPGLNGFVGEFLIFKGVFGLAGWAAVAATLGLLFTAIFLLTLLQRVFNGPLNERWAAFADLSRRERLIVVPATILMFVLGICPQILLEITNPAVLELVERLKS
jgi:NADH-quinone oxidoreductase subunit M